MSDDLNPYPGNLKQHKVDSLMPDDAQLLLLAGERDALLAARAKDAEEIAKWKGIVKGVHGALNDIGTVPVPPLDADLYDALMAIRAKDAELIQQLVDALWNETETHDGFLRIQNVIEAAAAAGYKPTNQ